MPGLGGGDNPSCQEDKHKYFTICANKCSSYGSMETGLQFIYCFELDFVVCDIVVVLVLIVTATCDVWLAKENFVPLALQCAIICR